MKKYTYTDGGRLFVRITKTTARKAYNNGFPYHPEISISGKATASFEEAVNSFEYYNLRGKRNRTAFYIPVRTVDRFTGEKPTAETLGTVQEYDYSYIGQ